MKKTILFIQPSKRAPIIQENLNYEQVLFVD